MFWVTLSPWSLGAAWLHLAPPFPDSCVHTHVHSKHMSRIHTHVGTMCICMYMPIHAHSYTYKTYSTTHRHTPVYTGAPYIHIVHSYTVTSLYLALHLGTCLYKQILHIYTLVYFHLPPRCVYLYMCMPEAQCNPLPALSFMLYHVI